MKKILLAALLVVVSTFSVVSFASSTASAATSCSGSLIRSQTIKNSAGTAIAYLRVYWNSSTGRNCAETRHASSTWGKSRKTAVYIVKCTQTTPTGCTETTADDYDGGYFKYYAGPVSVYSPKNCVRASGYIYTAGGSKRYVTTGPIGC